MDYRSEESGAHQIILIFPNEFIAERVVPVGFTIGVQQMNTNNLTEVYNFILASFQSSPDARVIGEPLYAKGKFTEAIEYYNKVLAFDPNNTGALYDKGLALDMLGLHGDAITYYDKLLSVYPDNINALVNKGAALSDIGRYSEALEYFDRALALDPNNVLAQENKELAELYASTDSPFSVD